jgi:PIN domain nuclease of toxin-antitoxin system
MQRLLLDTHTFLWWTADAADLSNRARKAIAAADSECWLSVVSVWELAIKISLDKLRLAQPLHRFVPEQLAANRIRLLPLELSHVTRVSDLPWHHRDPFDRLLVAQAAAEGLTLVTRDKALAAYGVTTLW